MDIQNLADIVFFESLYIYKKVYDYNPDFLNLIRDLPLEEFGYETLVNVAEELGIYIYLNPYEDDILVIEFPKMKEFFELYEELEANKVKEIDHIIKELIDAEYDIGYCFNYCFLNYLPEEGPFERLEIQHECLYDIVGLFEGIIKYFDVIQKGVKYFQSLIKTHLYEKSA